MNETNSAVFGKLEVFNHDKPMAKPFQTFLNPEPILMSHVSPYVSNTALIKNLWKPGQYAFKVRVFKDGHFSCVIPPGKYYLVEFDFLNFFAAAPDIGFRTYTGRWWQNATPYLMTFDVPVNHAVYIGTIRCHFYTQRDTPSTPHWAPGPVARSTIGLLQCIAAAVAVALVQPVPKPS
ncbi:MAG TPA: hypothetical protein VMA35_13325 [Candidatus Sulfopaludibacter sp.]|nr:hypothetical protein [Candidatus Sulfopaludibacter sp.]